MRLRNIIIGGAIILLVLFLLGSVEGFAYASNPCGGFKDCRTCADAAGCGWCPDLRQCQPMGQDGFPIRTKDLSTGDMDVSPYTTGNLPVNAECPPSCETTDLGDCNCIAPSVLNSCPPDCYAVYNAVGEGDLGAALAGSNTGSQVNCICPYASTNPKPGPYERKEYLRKLKEAGESETSDIIQIQQKDAALELESREKMILELQKSTRIHVCSPHRYVIDSRKC